MKSIADALKNAAKNGFNTNVEPELTRPDPKFGDYATNVALQLAGKVGNNPRQVAEKLVAELKAKLGDDIKDISIAGPGFINLTLSDAALLKQVTGAAKTKPQNYKGKVVVAEYSDPNPFKVLHAGHLYTTLVGDCLATLFEASGAKVHRVNYGGDVGLHVARAMWGILQELGGENPEKLKAIKEDERPAWLSQFYVKGTTAYEEDERAKAEIIDINKRVYELHKTGDHDTPFAQIYWTCRQWSYDGFDKLYKDLGVHSFERYIPESEVTPLGLEIVAQGLKEGVFEKSDGATVFKGEEHGLHTRVFINSNGLPTYEAKDLGLAAIKWRDYKFDMSFIITGNDIIEYMKVVVKALAHFHPQATERGKHLTHGMIKLPGGKKMSSRKGNILQASDILQAAAEASKATGRSNNADIVNGSVKYALLKQRIGGDIIYDPVESVSLEGNSGPYLQYAHARARSILAKVGAGDSTPGELDEHERLLARKISEYPEILQKAVDEFMPHHICIYLYELAQVFNRFYENSKVVGDAREAVRASLVGQYANVLKDGLGLLNIAAPERI